MFEIIMLTPYSLQGIRKKSSLCKYVIFVEK